MTEVWDDVIVEALCSYFILKCIDHTHFCHLLSHSLIPHPLVHNTKTQILSCRTISSSATLKLNAPVLGWSLVCPITWNRSRRMKAILVFTYFLTHSLTHSPTHSLNHSPSYSCTHSLIYSLAHSHVGSLFHSLTHTLTHWFSHSLPNSLILFPCLPLWHSVTYCLPHALPHSPIHSLTHSPTQ